MQRSAGVPNSSPGEQLWVSSEQAISAWKSQLSRQVPMSSWTEVPSGLFD